MTHRTAGLLAVLALLVATSATAQTAAKAAAADLSDAEIAHVAVTANTIDIELGRLAELHATSEAVRQFARAMIAAHSAVNGQAADLAQRLGLTPADNPTSGSLQQGAAQARALLEKLNGAAFDRSYIEREVAYHEAVLAALDSVLMPAATHPDLKALLEQVRPAVAGHLVHARQIHLSLEQDQ